MEPIVNKNINEFVEKIWERLYELDWTPTDLARASKLSQASISRILSGKQTNLTDNTRRKLKNALLVRKGKVIKLDAEKLTEKLIATLERQVEQLTEDNRLLREELLDLKKVRGIGPDNQKKLSSNTME